MTQTLASVTSVVEANISLDAGADIIDLKNPALGALGALPLQDIAQIVQFIRKAKPVSATIGDLPMQPNILLHAVQATAATGVDIIKIGFFGETNHAQCARALSPIMEQGARIVAVLFADQSPDFSLLPIFAETGFHGVMLDTADKRAGGLLHWMTIPDLHSFVQASHSMGLICGLAGALRYGDIAKLMPLGADYLGFRGALCERHERETVLNIEQARQICQAVAQMQHTEHKLMF